MLLLVGNIKSGNEIQKNIDGNKPSNTILINKLTPIQSWLFNSYV